MENIEPEIVKALPPSVVEKAYGDILSPSGRQVGRLSEDLVKALRFIIAPIQLLASYQDRLETFLRRTVEKVSEESRREADAEVAGPILEKLKFLELDTDIAEMFSNLLASSIDKETHSSVQPSFPIVLSQISHQEAILLHKLFPSGIRLSRNQQHRIETIAKILDFSPESLPGYLSHLASLGLLYPGYARVLKKKQMDLKLNQVNSIHFTPYGLVFMACCLRKDIPKQEIASAPILGTNPFRAGIPPRPKKT